MIKLTFINGNVFVFDLEDWSTLRSVHRIMGHIIGSTNFIPSLPSKLLPEEVLLLIDKELAEVVECHSTEIEDCKSVEEFENALMQGQQQEYKKMRRAQLETLIDKIVQMRRKVGDHRTKAEIFNEELDKSSDITKANMLWPIFLKDSSPQSLSFISKERITSLTNNLKTIVYRDLWDRGYYVTSGEKFGGNFLVYLGDPIIYHAIFIVKCIESERTFTPTELVAFGRLGVSVKKGAVLASVKDGCVSYVAINWIDA
ncbi:uncharacterized protein Tsen34 [Euwallacea fornicatus]|uniref:uncharacterized protein Tsen34 n=1 Tax=Euwallacea fornicatus TaxID=995702 RepID=UPI0033907160